MYVVHGDGHSIEKFDVANGSILTSWGTNSPSLPYSSGNPGRIAVDNLTGDVYVMYTGVDPIAFQKFDSNGNLLGTFFAKISGTSTQYSGQSGIAVDPSGNVYIADTNNNIEKFDSNGNFFTKWGSLGSGNGQFNNVSAVAVDPKSGNVYVSDSGNNRIEKFDSNGNFLTKWGSLGSGNGQFKGLGDKGQSRFGRNFLDYLVGA